MTQEQKELFFDLLAKKAVYGLDEADDNQLAEFDRDAVDAEFRSLELTAAAIGLVGVGDIEPMPEHLRASILKNAPFGPFGAELREEQPAKIYNSSEVFGEKRSSWFGWLGWAAAAAACVALAANIWFTRMQPIEQVKSTTPPEVLTDQQKLEGLMASTGAIKASWTAGNVKEIKSISGDIVWSDEKQTGYMRFRGLPVNDGSNCYQLWIFDKTQKKETPIDGGVFRVTSDGGVVVPITAKLKAESPYLFAVTIEKDGGVVVSNREKIAALAKVETQSS